jgi:hypothetical protein
MANYENGLTGRLFSDFPEGLLEAPEGFAVTLHIVHDFKVEPGFVGEGVARLKGGVARAGFGPFLPLERAIVGLTEAGAGDDLEMMGAGDYRGGLLGPLEGRSDDFIELKMGKVPRGGLGLFEPRGGEGGVGAVNLGHTSLGLAMADQIDSGRFLHIAIVA